MSQSKSKINRKTETTGFLLTLNEFIKFETTMSSNTKRIVVLNISCFGNDEDMTQGIDKNECGLLRDFFAHQFDRMEE